LEDEYEAKARRAIKEAEGAKQELIVLQKMVGHSKGVIELIKKTNLDLVKQIQNLERENKLSAFYFIPLKECSKKIETSVAAFEKQSILSGIGRNKATGSGGNSEYGSHDKSVSDFNLNTGNSKTPSEIKEQKGTSAIDAAKKLMNRK
jgi:hypothetical protein